MPDIQHHGSFILAVLIFQLVPGPGTLNILRTTADHGLKAGFAAAAGTLLGGLLCMGAAVSGLEAVLRGQPGVIEVVQWAGSAYLAWMGWCLLARHHRAQQAAQGTVAPSLLSQARRALAVSLTNPKVILFYFALFPLFLQGPVGGPTLVAMVLHVTGISLVWQGVLVVGGNAAARRLRQLPAAGRVAQRLAGLALMAFAIKLVLG